MKENDGRAARNKKKRRVQIVMSILGTILIVIIGLQSFSGESSSTAGAGRNSRAAQVLRNLHAHGKEAADKAHEALRRRAGGVNVAHWMQQHVGRGGGGGGGGGAGGDTAEEGDDGQEGDTANGDDENEDDDPIMQKILKGHFMIVNIVRRGDVEFDMHGGYSGLTASFCHLDWSQPKADATTTPMFHDLVDKSKGCERPARYELYDVVQKVRDYDAKQQQQHSGKIKLLNLSGVVFHESRCGSTLVANALAAMNPAQHRVYSEAAPTITILRLAENDGTGTLSAGQAATILKDVIYLMSRSNDLQEERVFFKFQSIGARSMSVFQEAYPTVPWIFVYRDPVQVMMSYLSEGDPHNANCVRPQHHPPDAVERLVEKYSPLQAAAGGARDLSYQDYCAAHLASLSEAAVEYMNDYGTP